MSLSQRDAFFNEIYELAGKDHDVVVVSADMGAPALDNIRRDLPGQFVNVGIAEQQAVLLASGLAFEKKKVFAYAIAPFITLRVYEQVKVEMAAMNLPVTLVGVGAGFSYDDSGPTHHTIEDLSIMRILPNLKIHNITDGVMAKAFAKITCDADYPAYVRLDRELLPNIYDENSDFSRGLNLLTEGDDLLIVATGNMVHRALEVAADLKEKSINASVMDLFTLPIEEDAFLEASAAAKKIVVLEEHTLPGGVGSAVCEVLCDHGKMIPVKRMGLNFDGNYCYKYGGRKNIQGLYGLDRENITGQITQWMES